GPEVRGGNKEGQGGHHHAKSPADVSAAGHAGSIAIPSEGRAESVHRGPGRIPEVPESDGTLLGSQRGSAQVETASSNEKAAVARVDLAKIAAFFTIDGQRRPRIVRLT